MAVPIVTSFAVQTISGLVSLFDINTNRNTDYQLSTYSERRARRHYYRRARHIAPAAFDTHIEFIARAHKVYKGVRAKLVDGPDPHDLASLAGPTLDSEPISERREDGNVYSEQMEEDKTKDTVVAGSITISSEETDSVRMDGNSETIQSDLLKRLMKLVVQMETEARDLLLDSMDHDIARTLLLADRNGQCKIVLRPPCTCHGHLPRTGNKVLPH